MNCEIPNCPYWCAESPILSGHDHRCAAHRDQSTTMRRARLALVHYTFWTSRNDADEVVTTAAMVGPRPPVAGREHDTGSTCVLRGGVAAAPRVTMTPIAGTVHEARATGNPELAYSLCPEGRRPGCAAAAAAVARGSLDTSA